MVLKTYKFSKRTKSTLQIGSISPVATYDNVFLKANTDLDSPVFMIDDVLRDVNYCYLEDIGRFYFIDKMVLGNKNIYELHCSCDVLATCKADILLSTGFVVYSSSDFSELLRDDRVAMLSDIEVKTATGSSFFTTTPSYILTVVGENGVQCIIPNDPNAIPATLYQQSATDLLTALCTQWADAQACLLDLIETPIAVGADYSATGMIGKIDIGSRACKNQYFNECREESTVILHIPESYKDFRLYAFCSLYLYLPMVGVVELNLQDYAPDPTALNRQVTIHCVANVLTGQVSYALKNSEGVVISVYTGACGRHIPINTSTPRDVFGSITHLVSGAVNIAGGNPVGAISNIVKSMSDSIQFKGSVAGSFNGSFGEYLGTDYVLMLFEHKSNIEPSNLTAVAGRPCGKVRSLAGLTGYVQCEGFQVNGAYTKAIKDRINELVNSGIYIE